MAFQQGLSGLNISSKALDAISANVANVNTVGFKASSIRFQDVYASSLSGGADRAQVGLGSQVGDLTQSFKQGPLTATGKATDLAITGNGFFMIGRSDGSRAYSRNGQFDVDKDGFIVTAAGEKLLGYRRALANGGDTPEPLQVPTNGMAPLATTRASLSTNLDSRAPAIPEVDGAGNLTFDPTDASTYTSGTTIAIFDSLGNSHTMSLFFAKREASAENNTWMMYATLDGRSPVTDAEGNVTDEGMVRGPYTLTFDQGGFLTAIDGVTDIYSIDGLGWSAEDLNNGAASMSFELKLANQTQHGAPFSVNALDQNGYSSGQLTSIAVEPNGEVSGNFSNGQTETIGQVLLATFRNPNGLQPLGDNLWAETYTSGLALVGLPGSGLNGGIASGMVEESNVDVSQELVQMIIQQRNYQANSQSIKAQDQLLQTLINIA